MVRQEKAQSVLQTPASPYFVWGQRCPQSVTLGELECPLAQPALATRGSWGSVRLPPGSRKPGGGG